jgi:O-acetyl-ADP-ribose deacetylase (regulator of RNase III)
MKHIKGDLVEMAKSGDFQVVVHGCNCFNTMGKGIAKQIKETWPSAYRADCNTDKGSVEKLGSISVAAVGSLSIVNAYTQFNYWIPGGNSSDLFEYEAFEYCIKAISSRFGGKGLKFGFPRIGAGLAGGDWPRIEKIIKDGLADEDVTIVEFAK